MLSLQITKMTKKKFVFQLAKWNEKWADFLEERSVSFTTAKSFIHIKPYVAPVGA